MKTLILVLSLLSLTAAAADTLAPKPAAKGPVHRQSLQFEDGVIEGMSHAPGGDASQVGERIGGEGRVHLYKLRASFADEMKDLSHEAEFGL